MSNTERPLSQQLMSTFHHLSHRVGRKQRSARGIELMRGQGRLLRSLEQEDGIPQQELAERVRIRPASASELISKMEQKGHIERKVDQEDRRQYLVYITEEGRAVAQQTREARAQTSEEIFSVLEPQEQQELLRLLHKVGQGMSEDDEE